MMGDLFGKTDHLKLSGKHDLKKKTNQTFHLHLDLQCIGKLYKQSRKAPC